MFRSTTSCVSIAWLPIVRETSYAAPIVWTVVSVNPFELSDETIAKLERPPIGSAVRGPWGTGLDRKHPDFNLRIAELARTRSRYEQPTLAPVVSYGWASTDAARSGLSRDQMHPLSVEDAQRIVRQLDGLPEPEGPEDPEKEV